MSPCLQLRYILDLSVCLQHHQVILCHYNVDVDHLLANLARLLALLHQLKFDFLLAGENSAVCITKPDQHIVVQIQMETP